MISCIINEKSEANQKVVYMWDLKHFKLTRASIMKDITEQFPDAILLEIIFHLSDRDKLVVRQVNKRLKKLIESRAAWSNNFEDFDTAVDFKLLANHQFINKIQQENLTPDELKALVKNLKKSKEERVININDETVKIIDRTQNKLIGMLHNKMQIFSIKVCFSSFLFVFGSGIAVSFIADENMYYWTMSNCYMPRQLLNCQNELHEYLIKSSFFSAPGAFGVGSILKIIDRGVDYCIGKKYYREEVDDYQKQDCKSKLWLVYMHRNVIAFVIWFPVTLYLIQKLDPSYEVSLDHCLTTIRQEECVYAEYDRQNNINQQCTALIGLISGYYLPIVANGAYSLIKHCLDRLRSIVSSITASDSQRPAVQFKITSTRRTITDFFLNRNVEVLERGHPLAPQFQVAK